MKENALVVLIHGLHQRGFIMYPMAKSLQKYGYRTHRHDYRSLAESVPQHSKRLNEWLEVHHNPEIPLHLIGHSLGGLVIRDFVNRYPQWKIGRCVSLGTPHVGSVSADYVKKLIPTLVGHSYRDGLDGSVAALPDEICMGVIAGNSPHGLGRALLTYHERNTLKSSNNHSNRYSNNQIDKRSEHSTTNHKLDKSSKTLNDDTTFSNPHASVPHQDSLEHDGTVYVSETRLPNATDHIVLPVSHTGMLINKEVTEQTAYFLKHGHFKR